MLARSLRILLLVRAAILAGLVFWLAGLGVEAGWAVPLAFGLLLLLHLALLILKTGVALRHHSIPQGIAPPGRAAVLAGALAEWISYLALYLVIMPFEERWMGPEPRPSPGRPVFLLLPGYLCNRGFWWWLRRGLRAGGAQVATLDLEPPFGDIDALAELVHSRLLALDRETGGAPVVLVGHSMGGLVGRACLLRHGAGKVARLVTLASPHHGTLWASLAPGRNARQMRRASPWLERLNGAGPPPVPALSVWSTHDAVVVPQISSRIAGLPEQVLTARGHLAMAFSPEILAILCRQLEGLEQRPSHMMHAAPDLGALG